MDPNRFDAIARALGMERSRRGMLKSLGAVALGAVGVASLSRVAEADNSGKVLVCHHTGSATNPYTLISVSANAAPTFAAQGDTVNVNLQTDPNNCGSCGNVCTTSVANATAICTNGTCGYTCNSGFYSDGHGGCSQPQCYWLDCFSGNGCVWDLNGDYAGTEADCQALDSCSAGGGGQSGGGCYKWAVSPDTVIAPPWPS